MEKEEVGQVKTFINWGVESAQTEILQIKSNPGSQMRKLLSHNYATFGATRIF